MGEEEKEYVRALIPRPLLPCAGEGEIVGCENRTFMVRVETTDWAIKLGTGTGEIFDKR